MNLEYFVSDIEKCTVEKVAVVFKGEAGKDVNTDSRENVWIAFTSEFGSKKNKS